MRYSLRMEREDGVAWAHAEIARTLVRTREKAGLSQDELAERLKKSQALVSRAESGEVRVGEQYMAAVLKACGLPADWSGQD